MRIVLWLIAASQAAAVVLAVIVGPPGGSVLTAVWFLGGAVYLVGLGWLAVTSVRGLLRLTQGGEDVRSRAERREWRRSLLAGAEPDADDRRFLAGLVGRWAQVAMTAPLGCCLCGAGLMQVRPDHWFWLVMPIGYGALLSGAGVARLRAAPLLALAHRIGAVPSRA